MAFVVEDGTGKADATSYASVEEGDAYHVGHLYATDWTGATPENKEAALMMATRTIEASVEWYGLRVTTTQALGFPRYGIPRSACEYYPDDEVPRGVKDATIDLARELLKADRTAEPDSKGIKSLGLGQSALAITFDAADRKAVFPEMVQLFLRPFGVLIGYGSRVRVRRV